MFRVKVDVAAHTQSITAYYIQMMDAMHAAREGNKFIPVHVDDDLFYRIYQAAKSADQTTLEMFLANKTDIDTLNTETVPLTAAAKLLEEGNDDAANLLIEHYGASIHFAYLGAIKAGNLTYLTEHPEWRAKTVSNENKGHYSNIRMLTHAAAYFNHSDIIDLLMTIDLGSSPFPGYTDIGCGAIMSNNLMLTIKYAQDDDPYLLSSMLGVRNEIHWNIIRASLANKKDAMQFLVNIGDTRCGDLLIDRLDEKRKHFTPGLINEAATVRSLMETEHKSFKDAYAISTKQHNVFVSAAHHIHHLFHRNKRTGETSPAAAAAPTPIPAADAIVVLQLRDAEIGITTRTSSERNITEPSAPHTSSILASTAVTFPLTHETDSFENDSDSVASSLSNRRSFS